jgi:hypothetical protein
VGEADLVTVSEGIVELTIGTLEELGDGLIATSTQ